MSAGPNPRPPAFVVRAAGCWPPHRVRLEYQPSAPPEDPRVAELKQAWPGHVAAIAARGGRLFNGPLVRCLAVDASPECLRLTGCPTDYATFYCTHYTRHDRMAEIGREHYANPLGVSANVITPDGFLVYGRRGPRVACHPHQVHTIGGTVTPRDIEPSAEPATSQRPPYPHVFAAIWREVLEELRLEPAELGPIVCLGIVEDLALEHPELVFDVPVTVGRAELLSRLPANDLEHAALVTCPDTPDGARRLLDSELTAVAVVHGALHLHRLQAERPKN
jgi:hypothetical protein